MLEVFRRMLNNCIEIGLQHNVSTLKALSKLCYHELDRYGSVASYYKLCAISRAAGILATRKKSIRRGYIPRSPYSVKPQLVSCYGFKIKKDVLKIPLGNRKYFDILLNGYSKQALLSDSSLTIRSFTLTGNIVSIAISKTVNELDCISIAGVDRNLRNLTVGDSAKVVQYDLSKAVDILENTRSILRSLKRNDQRIRKRIYSKYGARRENRINQLLHHVSKVIVQDAKKSKTGIAFEDIANIRRLYRRGNGQGKVYRGTMNSWSFAEVKRLVTYKAEWVGVPVIQLSKSETKGTSSLCPRCGEKLQVGQLKRCLRCYRCRREFDRDVVAAMNISYKGRAFLSGSGKGVFERPKGDASEAMKGNPTTPVILRVDASKLTHLYRR